MITDDRLQARVNFALALVGLVVSSFGTLAFLAIAPFVRLEYDLSAFEVGAIGSTIFLGALAATLPFGRLTDRIGAARMLGVGQLGLIVGLGLAALAPSAIIFFVGVGIAGLGYGAVNPSTNVLVSVAVSPHRRGLLMSVKQTGVPIGGALAGFTLPSIATVIGWRETLLVPLLACTVIGAIGLWLVSLQTVESSVEQQNPETLNPLSSFTAAIYGFIMAGVQITILGYISIYLIDVGNKSVAIAGVGLAIVMAGGAAGRLSWGAISDRFFQKRIPPLQLAAAGSLISLVLLPVANRSVIVWPLLALVGLCSLRMERRLPYHGCRDRPKFGYWKGYRYRAVLLLRRRRDVTASVWPDRGHHSPLVCCLVSGRRLGRAGFLYDHISPKWLALADGK